MTQIDGFTEVGNFPEVLGDTPCEIWGNRKTFQYLPVSDLKSTKGGSNIIGFSATLFDNPQELTLENIDPDYLHKSNIVHRDLKPDNILVHVDTTDPFGSLAYNIYIFCRGLRSENVRQIGSDNLLPLCDRVLRGSFCGPGVERGAWDLRRRKTGFAHQHLVFDLQIGEHNQRAR
jgi:hypothetical protein